MPITMYISPHVEEMVGYTPSEIVAMFRPPYGETFRKQVAARLKG